MLNPHPFFAPDYFATRDVTLSRLRKYSLDVVLRLTLDNPGKVFDTLIADLTARHTALFGSLSAADAGIGVRRGSAQIMWGALSDLADQLEEDEKLIQYKSTKAPAIATAFFPNGRREYGEATLLTAELLLDRADKAARLHAAALGTDFDATKYAGFLAAFKAGREGTGKGDEQTAKARASAQNQREDLTERLTDAVKLVAAQFLRDEARCAAYFRVELLRAGEAAPAEPDAG